MEYSFKQLPTGIFRKELSFLLIGALLLLVVNVIWIIICEQLDLSPVIQLLVFIFSNILFLYLGIRWFTTKHLVLKQIQLHPDRLVVVEHGPNELHAGITEKNTTFALTPEMIRCYRYLDDSDTAGRFEIVTNDPLQKLIIPNTLFTKSQPYETFITAIKLWFEKHGVRECSVHKRSPDN